MPAPLTAAPALTCGQCSAPILPGEPFAQIPGYSCHVVCQDTSPACLARCAAAAAARPTIESLSYAPCQATRVPLTSFGGPELLISDRSWPAGVDFDAVLDGTAVPATAVATEDGFGISSGWHDGPETDAIYFERYAIDAGVLTRTSHGWIDSVTRKLVQTG